MVYCSAEVEEKLLRLWLSSELWCSFRRHGFEFAF